MAPLAREDCRDGVCLVSEPCYPLFPLHHGVYTFGAALRRTCRPATVKAAKTTSPRSSIKAPGIGGDTDIRPPMPEMTAFSRATYLSCPPDEVEPVPTTITGVPKRSDGSVRVRAMNATSPRRSAPRA